MTAFITHRASRIREAIMAREFRHKKVEDEDDTPKGYFAPFFSSSFCEDRVYFDSWKMVLLRATAYPHTLEKGTEYATVRALVRSSFIPTPIPLRNGQFSGVETGTHWLYTDRLAHVGAAPLQYDQLTEISNLSHVHRINLKGLDRNIKIPRMRKAQRKACQTVMLALLGEGENSFTNGDFGKENFQMFIDVLVSPLYFYSPLYSKRLGLTEQDITAYVIFLNTLKDYFSHYTTLDCAREFSAIEKLAEVIWLEMFDDSIRTVFEALAKDAQIVFTLLMTED